MRRRLKEAVRLHAGFAMQPGHDYVVVARREVLTAPFEKLASELVSRIETKAETPAVGKGPLQESMMENNRNYFIAIALSVLIVLGWQFFYMNPRLEAQRRAEQAAKQHQQAQQAQTTQPAPAGTAVNGSLPANGQTTPTVLTRDQSVEKTASARVVIDTPALAGSINLEGARLDDLRLKAYHETVDKSSPIITLFSPADTKDGYFSELGYVGSDATGAVPGPSTLWKLTSGDKLTDKTPVTLSYTNDKGITFSRTIAVDDRYMFTITDKIANASQRRLRCRAMAASPATTSPRRLPPTSCMKASSALSAMTA